MAVSLSLANHHASLPVAYRLYLPQDWANDRARRRKAGVPEEIGFKTKPEIALDQLRWACEAGLPRGVVLMDAGYGNNSELRADITALGLTYVGRHSADDHGVGARHGAAAGKNVVGPRTTTEADAARRQASAGLGQGACARPAQAGLAHDQMARGRGRAAVLALCAPARSRGASRLPADRRPTGRVAADRVAEGRGRADQILALDPCRKTSPFADLVDIAKLRWRIERDYQELKQEVGLGHFEGRGWRGFHHHATLCIAAYGFLISERETIPPSGPRSASAVPGTCRTQRLPTQRLRRCGPNVTSRTRSPPCADA